jgi:hypothetical protein
MICPICSHDNREQEIARPEHQRMKAVNGKESAMNELGDAGIEAQFLDFASITGKVDHEF